MSMTMRQKLTALLAAAALAWSFSLQAAEQVYKLGHMFAK